MQTNGEVSIQTADFDLSREVAALRAHDMAVGAVVASEGSVVTSRSPEHAASNAATANTSASIATYNYRWCLV